MAPRSGAMAGYLSPATVFTSCFSMLALAEVGGNVTALIAFNYWMRAFEYGSATVTVNFLCAFFYVVIFAPLAVSSMLQYMAVSKRGREVARRRLLIFLRPRQLGNALLIAFADCWIDIASTYAAGHTTVLTQVFAKSAEPLVTMILTRFVLREARKVMTNKFARLLPVAGFIFVGLGVVLHMWQRLEHEKHNEKATAFYIILYFTGVISSSCYAITQSRFIRQATAEFEAADREGMGIRDMASADEAALLNGDDDRERNTALGEADDEQSMATQQGGRDGGRPAQTQAVDDHDGDGDDDVEVPRQLIRSMALAMDTSFTLVITLIVVPLLDIIPNFGHSDSYADVWTNLHAGFHCVFHCSDNLQYAILTNGGWILVYLADTVMNHFSPTLNSMVNEFTAPIGVIVMYLHPAWSLSGPPDTSSRSIVLHVASVACLVIGVLAFARYEVACSKLVQVILPKGVRWEPKAIGGDGPQTDGDDVTTADGAVAVALDTDK